MVRTPGRTTTTGLLKEYLKQHLHRLELVPPMPPDAWLRASSFAELCPREEILRAKHGIQRIRKEPADAVLNFALGSQMHWVLQNQVLCDPGVDLIRGRWQCAWCGWTIGGNEPDLPEDQRLLFHADRQVARPKLCEECKSTIFQYVEQHFGNYEYQIAGHPDGFLELPGQDGLGVVEIKSIGERGIWEVKRCPSLNHTVQSQSYLWFTGLKWAIVFYWDKSKYGLSAVVDHLITRDEDLIEAIKTQITVLRTGLRNGLLTARTCVSSKAPRAIRCSACKECFAEGDHVVASEAPPPVPVNGTEADLAVDPEIDPEEPLELTEGTPWF